MSKSLVLALGLLAALGASAHDWPSKPVRFIDLPAAIRLAERAQLASCLLPNWCLLGEYRK